MGKWKEDDEGGGKEKIKIMFLIDFPSQIMLRRRIFLSSFRRRLIVVIQTQSLRLPPTTTRALRRYHLGRDKHEGLSFPQNTICLC